MSIAVCLGIWSFVTRGEAEERVVSPITLPSPEETFSSFPQLWSERSLLANATTTLKRVFLGFCLAVAVAVPLGILAGCFSPVEALLSPLIIFGRNIPIAALIPLSMFMFGVGEMQKVMFIFIACAAFILADTATAIKEVGSQYVDTAYTLGAGRWQVIIKVLTPLAMPSVFNTLRLLFGLAFGYIMLAESIKMAGEEGGLGHLINISQRRGPREHIYLIILIIPAVAVLIDRLLYWIQRELFPHRYGGVGFLNQCVRSALHGWESVKGLVVKPKVSPEFLEAIQRNTPDNPT
jgi:NitT/TauT family transport system permease protein